MTLVADHKGRVCFVNTEGHAVLGAAATQALLSGQTLGEAFAEDCRKLVMEEGIPTAIESGVWHGEAALLGQERSVTPVALSISARSPGAEWLVCVATDISQQRARERQLEHLATHDALTGLPNLTLFSDRLARELHVARRSNRPFAVLFLDIDLFKQLNDSIGHERANRVLAELGVRLYSCVRAIDTVARYGGDEFAIIVTNLNSVAEITGVIKRVHAATMEPFSVLGKHVDLSVSIGVAAFPLDASDGESLVIAADRDMYRCKRRARRARRAPATEHSASSESRTAGTSPLGADWH
ncbi:MAG: diguanylate cyclase domain-containing protein [Gemmatimonadaceae bacterium]